MTDRKALHAYVSDGAHDQWHDFAARQGISVSAILEALAPEFSETDDADFAELIRSARHIDALRRRRSPSSTT